MLPFGDESAEEKYELISVVNECMFDVINWCGEVQPAGASKSREGSRCDISFWR